MKNSTDNWKIEVSLSQLGIAFKHSKENNFHEDYLDIRKIVVTLT